MICNELYILKKTKNYFLIKAHKMTIMKAPKLLFFFYNLYYLLYLKADQLLFKTFLPFCPSPLTATSAVCFLLVLAPTQHGRHTDIGRVGP